MNKELYDELGRRIAAIEVEKARIIREFNEKQRNNSFSNNASKIKAGEKAQAKVIELNEKKNVYSIARKNVEFAVAELKKARTQEEREKAKAKLKNANLKMQEIADKDGILYDNEEHEIKSVNEPKKQDNSNLVAWGLVLAIIAGCITVGVKGCDPKEPKSIEQAVDDKDNKDSITFDKANSKESVVSEDNNEKITEQLPKAESLAKKYGMTTKFTDASDEKQVMARAQEIYNLYVNSADVTEETKRELSVERLANIIRMCNGEFALEDGEVRYSRGENDVTSFTELGNWINCYSNSTSFENYKNQLRFKPLSVFFEEDTDAYAIAVKADGLVKNIYDDIRANDVAKFTEDAKAWGEFVKYTVIKNDFNPNYISLWSINTEQQYPLLKTITTTFAPSILEYAINIGLASQNETYGICIPYCFEHGVETNKPLSLMIYDINETPMNALAERAGKYDEWKENNDPIMVQVGYACKAWFDSKYDREIGYSKKLK